MKRSSERSGSVAQKCCLFEGFLAGETLHALGEGGEKRVGTLEEMQEHGAVDVVADCGLLEGGGIDIVTWIGPSCST